MYTNFINFFDFGNCFVTSVFASSIVMAMQPLPKAMKVNEYRRVALVELSSPGKSVSGADEDRKSAVSKPYHAKTTSPPQFKDDEYAIFLVDTYSIFKTKKFGKLELVETCFKNGKPACEAYEFAQIKPKNLTIKYEGFNNMSAIHCEAVNGRNLLALDNKNNHYNFCRFGDGSMVNSWSMYYKHFPSNVTK